jgi:hypothetical protein
MIIEENETKEQLMARGVSEHDAVEVIKFREYLRDRSLVTNKSPQSPEEALRIKEMQDYESGLSQ